jgi:excisionase family DNA binding protein
MLGVSLSTLRRWADAGKIPIHRTLGGHRRFSRHELQALVMGHSALSSLPASTQAPSNSDRQTMDQQEWHRKVSERPVAERMRGLGQRLLGLLIQHVHSRTHENRFLTEAGTVGTTYGKEAFDASISLQDTVRAFLYFRRTCSQLTSPADGIAYPVDLAEAAKLQEQIDAFMDAVLLGVLAGYESQRLLQAGEDTSVATGEGGRQ